ncbi:MAG: efflux RND transporter periplasmic adaptor subunit [Pseudomonadota bacterium]
MHVKTVLIALAAVALAHGGQATAQDTLRLAKIVPVEVFDGSIERQFFGRVTARETVDLAFQVSGQITEFPAVEGEPIPKGGTVARLDLEPFELALDQARTQQVQADRNLARLEQLQGSAVSQVSVDDAMTQADLAAISVRNAERSLRQATLAAPFDALVASRNVANFSTINAGTPVVRLHDMSELRIEIDVPEIIFQTAGEDPDVTLTARFPAIDEDFALQPREFNAETSSVGQTFRITLGMPPPDGRVILPGSSVTVTAVLRLGEPRVVIPSSGVLTANDGQAQVMLFEPSGADEGTLRRVDVTIEPTPEGEVQVLSGLAEGQEIVASGAALLSDGEMVRRFDGFAE